MCPCESRNVMVTGPSCCHHHQTGKLPDKALIITSRHSRVITPHYHVLCEWKHASHHFDDYDDDDDQDDTWCEWPWSLLIGWCMDTASHWLLSSWWRKLNHLLIEDDKEPTHLCYPQWSHSHTMTTRQSPNNPPNTIQLSSPVLLSIVSEISTQAPTKKEKLSQESEFTWIVFTP